MHLPPSLQLTPNGHRPTCDLSSRRFEPASRRTITATLLALVCASTSFSQTKTSSSEDEVIELSPFVINVDGDQGYLAANTMSGSRMNTSLADTPASISEFTSEFLSDINAKSVMEAIDYSVGFVDGSDATTNGNPIFYNDVNISSRGVPRQGATRATARNYFIWYLNGDTYNTDRLSLSRGPNSILFGLGDPGGVINTATKQANARTATSVGLSVDDEGSQRVTLDHNQRVTGNFFLRLNSLWEERKTWREGEYYDQVRNHFTATWQPTKTTTIRAEYEHGEVDQVRARPWLAVDRHSRYLTAGSPTYNRAVSTPYPSGIRAVSGAPFIVFDSSSNTFMNWRNYGTSDFPPSDIRISEFSGDIVPSLNLAGPAGTVDFDFETYSVFLEQKIASNLYFEAAYNEQSEFRDVRLPLDWNQVALSIDPNVTRPDGSLNPHLGDYYVEGQAQWNKRTRDTRNLRATLVYELDPQKDWLGHHRLLAFASREELTEMSLTYKESNATPLLSGNLNRFNVPNRIMRRTYLDFDNGPRAMNQNAWTINQAPVAISSNGVTGVVTPYWATQRMRPSSTEIDSILFAGQSYFLPKDKLILTYGWRQDAASIRGFSETIDPVTREATAGALGDPTDYEQSTVSYGGLFHVNKSLSVFGNISENFSPQTAYDIYGNQIGNNIAEGTDFGIKLSLLDNKIYGHFSYFTTVSQNRARISNSSFAITEPINRIWEVLEGANSGKAIISGYQGSIDFESSGLEFEVTANPIKGLALTANYGNTNATTGSVNATNLKYVEEFRPLWQQSANLLIADGTATIGDQIAIIDAGLLQDRLEEGGDATNVRSHVFNLVAKYSFQTGMLKRFEIGTGARYRSADIIGFRTDDGSAIRGTDYWLYDLRIGYRQKIFANKVLMRINLNIRNLLNEDELIGTDASATGDLESYVFQSPRSTTLRVDFSF